jgi:SAM-dependent methyltransferase
MLMTRDKTLDYYDQNAPDTARRYETADLSSLLTRAYRFFTGENTEPPNILEIGPGSGRDAAWFLRQGAAWQGIDGSDAMIAQAEELHPELRGRLRHHRLPDPLPFRDGSFSACYAAAVLMHLPAREARDVLHEISRVLKPRGRLVFSVPLNRPHIDESGLDDRGRRFTNQTEEQWEKDAAAAGFTVLEKTVQQDSLDREGIVWLSLFCVGGK